LNRLVTSFDRVPPFSVRACHTNDLHRPYVITSRSRCNLKRVPPKSRSTASLTAKFPWSSRMRSARTPPSTFLFLLIHLSNNSEPLRTPLPETFRKPPTPIHPMLFGCFITALQ